MYISTFKPLREKLLNEVSISSLVKPSYTSFFDSAIVSVAAFVLDVSVENFKGDYFDLGYLGSAESQPIKLAAAILDQNSTDRFLVEMNSFREIPDHPIAYWITKGIRQAFVENPPLSNISTVAVGLQTGNNNRFLRRWYEVSIDGVGFNILSREDSAHSKKKWFPYNKGGDYRKWYGNQEYLVNWGSDGKEISDFKPRAVIRNPRFYFQPSISWSFISSSYFGVRVYPQGFVFDVAGSSIFPSKNEQFLELAGFLCSCVAPLLMKVMNPTVNFQAGNVELLPVKQVNVSVIAEKCIDISKAAVQQAAKQHKNIQFAVASTFDLPLAANSQHAVVQVFAPASSAQIHRVLVDNGLWLSINPASDHLFELKSMVYDTPQQHSAELNIAEGFRLLEHQRLRFVIALHNAEQRHNLLMMTPFYWSISEEKKQRLRQHLQTVTADFSISVLAKH